MIEADEALEETFRESDIIARIGGDEFVVLAVETNGSPAEVLIHRLQENLAARNARGGRRYELSFSVGLARYDPERPCSIEELLAQADQRHMAGRTATANSPATSASEVGASGAMPRMVAVKVARPAILAAKARFGEVGQVGAVRSEQGSKALEGCDGVREDNGTARSKARA